MTQQSPLLPRTGPIACNHATAIEHEARSEQAEDSLGKVDEFPRSDFAFLASDKKPVRHFDAEQHDQIKIVDFERPLTHALDSMACQSQSIHAWHSRKRSPS